MLLMMRQIHLKCITVFVHLAKVKSINYSTSSLGLLLAKDVCPNVGRIDTLPGKVTELPWVKLYW